MCGIAGLFLTHGDAPQARLRAAAEALAHRGPDGEGIFCAGPVGLVHTRLSIIDLDHGAQPLHDPDGRYTLVANGEIYNFVELRRELEAKGHCFTTGSDCEAILHAYAEWGTACLDRLLGMFAFALFDRERDELLLARDRLGIKPLFLRQDGGGIAFGSEIKALTALSGRTPEVDGAGLVQFLQNNFTSGATTLVAGVERLAPGEAVRVVRGAVAERWRYWRPRPAAERMTRFEEATRRFDTLLDEVMTIHLRSDVPFGLFLSGGTDSAVLLAMLDRHVEGELATYSVGFPGSSVANELTAAGAMARRFGTRHTVLELEEGQLLRALPHAIWAADELMGDYANLPVSLLARRAATDLKVVFSGEGGDEVFAGYARYRPPAPKRWLKALRHPGSGGFRMSATFKGRWPQRLFGPRLRARRDAWRDPFIASWRRVPEEVDRLARMQIVDIETWLPDDLLVKADRMLMAWGVEGRVPFLDHRIVEFGLALAPELKIEGKTGKLFLRRWAERHLPKEHLWARKQGFTVPVRDWLGGELLDRLERLLPAQEGIRQWFDRDGVRALIARQRSHRDMVQPLWRLWQFALWHRIFIEEGGAMPPPECDPVEFLASSGGGA